jgi:hypothetical protein
MGRHISLSLVEPAMLNKRYRPSRERHLSPIAAIDLLSTRTRQILQFSSSPAHTVPTAVSDLTPLMHTLVHTLEPCLHRRRRIAASGISDPKWCRGWRREHQLQPWSNAPRLGLPPSPSRVGHNLRPAFRLRRTPRGLATDTPCHADPPPRCHPAWLTSTKDPFHDAAPTPPLSRPEAPSAYESPPPHCQLALTAKGGAAAGTSALPPRPSVRHAFTRRLYALDPIT